MIVDRVLSWVVFGCIALVVAVAPWLFAAWEMWFFWPFVAVIFAASFFSSVRLLIGSVRMGGEVGGGGAEGERGGRNIVRKVVLVGAFGAFLSYVVVRFLQADVFMDAERSLLLWVTPVLLGVQVIFGFERRQLKWLYSVVLVNVFLLGLYGVVNHVVWKNVNVLWVPGYLQYQSEGLRATGSYFCPDHFAGLMEIGFGLALGLLLARGRLGCWRVFGVCLAVVSLVGVVLSKSRGGGFTLVVMVLAVVVAGFAQWPAAVRWAWRSLVLGVAGLVLMVFCHFESHYMNRFREHLGLDCAQGKPVREVVAIVKGRLLESCRGQMYSAALRAWRDRRDFGIGPGMHQNLWLHYAPSPDGDREKGVWPTFPNNMFHSYEVHNDWLQLLEEYGVVGLALFLLPLGAVAWVLAVGIWREVYERDCHDWLETGNDHYHMIIGAVLACIAMAFHSLGDFNLQMPATVWLLAVVASIPMAYILE